MLPVTVQNDQERQLCPIRNVLAKVTGKWQMLILLALEDEPKRFGVLKRTIGDVTQRVLTENLRSLERDGYLTRTVDGGPPLSVTYELTSLGRALLTHLKPLAEWAAQSFDQVREARSSYDS